MVKRRVSNSASEPEVDEENAEKTSSAEEEEDEQEEEIGYDGGGVKKKQGTSEYEKRRLSRMAENRARMEALGLHKIASSLMGSAKKSSLQQKSSSLRKGKRKVGEDDDEDYKPDDNDDEDDDVLDEDNEDEDLVGRESSSKARKNKNKKRSPKSQKKVPVQEPLESSDYMDEDNDELMQAIALSLQDSAKDATPKEIKGNVQAQNGSGRRSKKSFISRVKMTGDEVDLHFFQFDEADRGFITRRDLKRLATAHDFTWTDKELEDMIYFFDSDKDGKLNLDDFRKIVGRCNMMQESECN